MCLVGKKGADPAGTARGVGSDIIYAERRGQSQKPEEIYQLVEELVPGGQSLSCQALACTKALSCLRIASTCANIL